MSDGVGDLQGVKVDPRERNDMISAGKRSPCRCQ